MDIKYWQGGLERHEIDAIEKIKNVLSTPKQQENKRQGFDALNVLKTSFNTGWKGYAGFRFVNKSKQGEIDLLIVTHCNILIIELKDWNGQPITSNNGKWFFGNDDRGKSPVEITRNKTFLLDKLLKPLKGKFSNGKHTPRVYFLVVMTGTSDFSKLQKNELAETISLDDFCKLCTNEHAFNKRFTPHPESKVLLNDIPLLEKRLLNDNKVESKPLTVDGWIGQEEIFKHPGEIYSEFYAQSESDKNDRAIIRKWDFDKLSNHDAKTPDGRFKIVSREREVLTKIKRENRDLYDHCVSSLTIPSKDKITSQYNEVVELPQGQERLNDFITSYGENLSIMERVNLAKVLIARFADLHELNLAHRDIGRHSVWLSTGQRVALSNFISAFNRKKETVGAIRDELSVYGQKDDFQSHYHYDVSRLAIIAWAIIKAERLTPKFEQSIAKQFTDCDDWFTPVLLNAFEGKRYANAGELLDALVKSEPSQEEVFSFSSNQLERFVKHSKVGRLHPEVEFVSENDSKEVYKAETGLVKVWNNINSTEINAGLGQRTLFFLERVEKLQSLDLSFVPKVIDVGITSRDSALYLVTEWILGTPLDPKVRHRGTEDIVKALVSHVMHMHSLGFSHGDLKPENLILADTGDIFIIDVLDFHHDAEEVYNSEYSPVNVENSSAFERDNYAVMKICAELLNIDWGEENNNHPAISSAIIEELKDVDYGFKELTRFKDAVVNPEQSTETAIETINIEIGSPKEEFETLTIYPDNGKLYVSIEESRNKASGLVISFCGLGGIQKLFFDSSRFEFEHGMRPIKRDSISRRDVDNADFEVPFAIRIVQGRSSQLDSLNRRVKQLYSFENAIKQFQLKRKEASKPLSDNVESAESHVVAEMLHPSQVTDVETSVTPISTRELWQAIIQTESESHPYVELTGEPMQHKDSKDVIVLPYEAEKDPLDAFTAKDEVEAIIVDGENEFFIGQVNLAKSGLNKVTLSRSASRVHRLKEDDVIFFRSKADKSSFNKRKNALTRIIENDSVIENLVDYFDPDCQHEPIDYGHIVTDKDFDRYNREDDNGNVIKLNDKQRIAFQQLLRFGPLSMLQGPPGTGKTEFIAAFVHHLVEKLGTERILLVSQSHEAVNTAAERIRKHCNRLETPLDVVRFSSRESAVSNSLRDALSSNIVSQKAEQFSTQLKFRVMALAKSLKAPKDYLEAFLELDKQVLSAIAEQLNALTKLDDKELDSKQRKELKKQIGERKSLINSRLPRDAQTNKDWHDDLSAVGDSLIKNLNNEYAIEPHIASSVKRLIDMSKDMLKVMNSGNANLDEFLARSRQLVAGTCVGIGNWHIDIASNQYDWIIIDEAARSIASELAIAMQVGKRVLLVGDHKQLPPLYSEPHKQALARKLGIKSSSDIDELIESDFARAFNSHYGEQVGAKLLVQYRMAPPIGTLVSECFYNGELENGERIIPDIYTHVPKQLAAPATWLDTSSLGKKAHHQQGAGTSIYNDAEVDAIVDMLSQVDENDEFVNSLYKQVKEGEAAIGVICMYAEQKKRIRQRIKKVGLSEALTALLKIDTVDSYQGKENRIIILSLTRSEPKQSPGFMRLPNRINVALSRVMDRLVIVGDKRMWQGKNSHLPFGRVIKFMDENNSNGQYAFLNVTTKKQTKAA
ncbi:AAA domain-containing protein [Moritella viscosa]|uniref:AAA domain-containing protein n=1 Tax=Moritella viscosa TaxID=80854 RepID=UPI0009219DC7|nr:AAA domain-containing protein [Moritella viscosa]SGZ02079.1 Superfamily I DNA and RNA helicase and helicase subunit [Moritella viscosa]